MMAELAGLDPQVARGLIPEWLGSNVVEEVREDVVSGVSEVLAPATAEELQRLLAAFQSCGEGYQLHSADPLARRISHAFMRPLLPEPEVVGLEGLRAACQAGPTLWLSNHFSYVDTQATDAMLAGSGADDIAQSVVAVAGPKVYGTSFRKMASTCLTTLKTAQSASLSHNEAALSLREVARIAIQTLREADALARAGRPILIYAEGARTRTGRLQPFLKAVAKYGRAPGMQMIPVAITGTQELYPIDAEQMRPARVRLTFGEPVSIEELGRVDALVETWRRVGLGLPESQRPDPETSPTT